nr:MAG TPA: holin [Caudoviricetes sp.]
MRNSSFVSNGKLRIWNKGFIDCIRNRQQKSSGHDFNGLSPDIRARRSCKLRKEFQTNHKPIQQNLHRAIIGSVTASIFYTKKERRVSYMSKDKLQWLKAAGIRAVKTIAQTAVATIGTATVLGNVDWKMVVSASVLSGVLSLLTSVAGLPELKTGTDE